MAKWEIKWTGYYPCLCMGDWEVYKDGKEIPCPFQLYDIYASEEDKLDPFADPIKSEVHWYEINPDDPFLSYEYTGTPAYTFGLHYNWYFDEDFLDQWDTYKDGTNFEHWCDEHKEWLEKYVDKEDYKVVYAQFASADWRYGECGGCI